MFSHPCQHRPVKAYSYVRFSSGKQGDGDSIERQLATARRVCDDRGWLLEDLPAEQGVSAWKGKNLSHSGILGQFINKVEIGEITTPCVLVIEKIDRFSRAEVDEVLPLFVRLLKTGVNVYSHIENQYYTKEALKENPLGQLLPMLLAFYAANQYSKALSDRVKAAKQSQIKKVIDGERIYLSSSCPYYMDWDKDNKIYVPNDKQELVQRIAKEYIDGKQLQAIARQLNIEKVPSLRNGEAQWRSTTIKQLLSNKAIIGYFKGIKIYPETISAENYIRIQGLLERNRIGKGRNSSDFINILRGKLVCSICGGKLGLHTKPHKRDYYRCPARSRGICDANRFIPVKDTERFILAILLETTPEELLTNDSIKIRQGIKDLEIQALGITKQIQRLVVLEGLDIEEVRTQLNTLKEQRDNLNKQILIQSSKVGEAPLALLNSLKELGKRDDVEAYEGMNEHYNKLMEDLDNPSVRIKVRELLQGLVKHIIVDLQQSRLKPVYTNGTEGEWMDLVW